MTRKFNKDNGLQDWKTEHQAVTCGIFYCRDSDENNGSGSHQTSSRFDSAVLRNRQQNIPLSVGNKCKDSRADRYDSDKLKIRKDLAF